MHSRTGTAHYRSTTSGSGQPKTTVQTTSVAMGWGQLRSRSCAYEQEEGGRENEQSGSGGRDQRSKRRRAGCASLFPARKTSSPRGGGAAMATQAHQQHWTTLLYDSAYYWAGLLSLIVDHSQGTSTSHGPARPSTHSHHARAPAIIISLAHCHGPWSSPVLTLVTALLQGRPSAPPRRHQGKGTVQSRRRKFLGKTKPQQFL
jgi:hypothetical protein